MKVQVCLSSATEVKNEGWELLDATQNEDICDICNGLLHGGLCAKHSQHSIVFLLLLNEQTKFFFYLKKY